LFTGDVKKLLTTNNSEIIIDKSQQEFYKNIHLSMRDLLLREVSRDILLDQPEITEIAKRIRDEAALFPMSKHEVFKYVAGVDAGSQILPLASRQYAIISALVYSIPSGEKFFLPPETLTISNSKAGNMFKATINLRREAKLYETALIFLKDNPETELMLIDGPLCFSDWWKLSGGQKDQQRLINSVNQLLKACRETKTILAGVVKRPSARYFVYHLGIETDTVLPDSSLLLQTLRPGERTDIFSPKNVMQKAHKNSDFMNALEVSVYSFYSRMTQEWNIPPIRVDVPAYCLTSVNDVADYCYATSMFLGIPLPIVKADDEVKITRKFMAGIYGEILSKISRSACDVRGLAPIWGEGHWMGA